MIMVEVGRLREKLSSNASSCLDVQQRSCGTRQVVHSLGGRAVKHFAYGKSHGFRIIEVPRVRVVPEVELNNGIEVMGKRSKSPSPYF